MCISNVFFNRIELNIQDNYADKWNKWLTPLSLSPFFPIGISTADIAMRQRSWLDMKERRQRCARPLACQSPSVNEYNLFEGRGLMKSTSEPSAVGLVLSRSLPCLYFSVLLPIPTVYPRACCACALPFVALEGNRPDSRSLSLSFPSTSGPSRKKKRSLPALPLFLSRRSCCCSASTAARLCRRRTSTLPHILIRLDCVTSMRGAQHTHLNPYACL